MNSALRRIRLHKESNGRNIIRNKIKCWRLELKPIKEQHQLLESTSGAREGWSTKDPRPIQSHVEKHQHCVYFQYFTLLFSSFFDYYSLHCFTALTDHSICTYTTCEKIYVESKLWRFRGLSFIKSCLKSIIKVDNGLKTLAVLFDFSTFCVTSSSEA